MVPALVFFNKNGLPLCQGYWTKDINVNNLHNMAMVYKIYKFLGPALTLQPWGFVLAITIAFQ